MKLFKTVTAPDLQIRGEPSHPDPEIKGGGAVSKKKKLFQPFGPQFGLTIRGGVQAPPLDPPLQKLLLKLKMYKKWNILKSTSVYS